LISQTEPSRADGSSPLRAPCSGPTCSRQSIPFTPPPAPSSVEQERWAFPLLVPFLTEDSVVFVYSNVSSSQSITQPSSIYHPPR
jgi:hypothetical protein